MAYNCKNDNGSTIYTATLHNLIEILWKLEQMWIAKEWMALFMGLEIL